MEKEYTTPIEDAVIAQFTASQRAYDTGRALNAVGLRALLEPITHMEPLSSRDHDLVGSLDLYLRQMSNDANHADFKYHFYDLHFRDAA